MYLKHSKTLSEDIVVLKPHVVIISRYLPGELDIKEYIKNLDILKVTNCRVVYLYGEEDIYRKQITNFLIENGFYDFHVGDIDEESINNLLFKPKKREEVQLEEISEIEKEIASNNLQLLPVRQ